MRAGDILTQAYNLGDMAETAKAVEAAEVAVEQVEALFPGIGTQAETSRGLRSLGNALSEAGIHGYRVQDRASIHSTAQVTPSYESLEHNGVNLGSRIARIRLMHISRLAGRQTGEKAAIFLLGLAHERQKTVSEALYRWGVFHDTDRDSAFFRLRSEELLEGVPQLTLLPCTPEQQTAIVGELTKAHEVLKEL